MNWSQMHSVSIENFRSIRGQVHAPLDANVVLVHGENGAGKTSLLSAIELALTGKIESLHRFDPGYVKQLLHKKASHGYVDVKLSGKSDVEGFRADISAAKITQSSKLEGSDAEFFAERSYLPQSLLGQLLQIYQDSGADADSPLARFVSSLLGLDRLDALEGGLKPLQDVRNVRRLVRQWSVVENEISRLKSFIEDQKKTKAPIEQAIAEKRAELVHSLQTLGIAADKDSPEDAPIATESSESEDEERLAFLTDKIRLIASVRRDIDTTGDSAAVAERDLADRVDQTASALRDWQESVGGRISDVRSRAESLLPNVKFSSDLNDFRVEADRLLKAELAQLTDSVQRARDNSKLLASARERLGTANNQLLLIDRELSVIASNSGALSAALAEISGFVSGDICPVCDRDFNEMGKGALQDHVHAKASALSSSSERLISLSQSRANQSDSIDQLRKTISNLESLQVSTEELVESDRRAADVGDAVRLLHDMGPALGEGQRLIEADVAARRALVEIQQRNGRRLAVHGTLEELSTLLRLPPSDAVETVEKLSIRLEQALVSERDSISERLRLRRKALDSIEFIRGMRSRRDEADQKILEHQADLKRNDAAFKRAEALRRQGQAIRSAVDEVRSAVIRSEFNDRLNKLWRDLFVRLAPTEEFIPAFRIPGSETRGLQPKLYTPHRDLGDDVAGGTPGAMLSAGNLNTAALTLFIALHLSVPEKLPWLLLDDPVQSMDDVHIAHFAALLRTLAKEHQRQVIIAVHDRQLFEYLRLELSPAFADDSLITLELSRSSQHDTQCFSRRYSFQEEKALRVA